MADTDTVPRNADSGDGNSGSSLSGFLKKKTGPLPNAAWLFLAVAVIGAGYMYKQRNSSIATPIGSSGAGDVSGSSDGGTFSSTSSTTDPTTGDQTTYTASGPTAGYLGGGVTSANASPMGYSGGDVFVNYPGQTTAPTVAPSGPAYPPVHATPATSGQTGGWWYTLGTATNPGKLAATVYGMNQATIDNPSQSFSQILAADLVHIMSANPQLDWTRLTANPNNNIPAGTAIFVPIAGGGAGIVPTLPKNASLNAPAYYTGPPAQQTTMTALS